MTRVVLHIGTLKTGTTSFQRWFSDNESAITSLTGFRWYRGEFPDAREIAAACIDEDRQTPAMALGFFPTRPGAEWDTWRRGVLDNVRSQIAVSQQPLYVSCEALCLLRAPSEIARLAGLFEPATTKIVLTLRNPRGFLDSWKQHLEHDFFRRSNDPTSFAYVHDDSWLVDYAALEAAYRAVFADMEVIDYDAALSHDGSIIPALAATFTDRPIDELPSWDTYRLNRSARPPREPVKGLARPRHYLRWYKWKTAEAVRQRVHRLRRSSL